MLRFLARKHGGLSLLFFAVAVAIALSPRSSLPWTSLGRSIGAGLSGLQGVGTRVIASFAGVARLTTVSQENRRLRAEVGQLRAEKSELERLAAEAEHLHRLLDLRATTPYAITPAAVIGRDPSNWYRSLIIEKGLEHGLALEMAVIAREGVVGTLIQVGPRYAKVRLVTDRMSAIAAMNERTRDQGIVEGLAGGRLRLKYLLLQTEVRAGDVILATGLEGIFPRGLVIGRVHRVGRVPGELVHAVEVTPAVNLSRLETVEVVTASPVREAVEELR